MYRCRRPGGFARLRGLPLGVFRGLSAFVASAAPALWLEVQGAIGLASANGLIRGIVGSTHGNAPMLVVCRLDQRRPADERR